MSDPRRYHLEGIEWVENKAPTPSARAAQPAPTVYVATGDEWNATTRLYTLKEAYEKDPTTPLNAVTNADQLAFAIECVEALGKAEWLVRQDRDRLQERIAELTEYDFDLETR